MSHLIVLTENALTEHDVTRIVEWHDTDLKVHVLVPETSDQSAFDQVVDDVARVDMDELKRDLAGTDEDDKGLAAKRALSESLRAARRERRVRHWRPDTEGSDRSHFLMCHLRGRRRALGHHRAAPGH